MMSLSVQEGLKGHRTYRRFDEIHYFLTIYITLLTIYITLTSLYKSPDKSL